jgi:multicomponent Na+:H+ antiporter subunit D
LSTLHFPVLQIVIPLLGAPGCALLRSPRLAWLLTLIITWTVFGIASVLLWQVFDGGIISYEIGAWPPPWGIEYRIDVVNAFVLFLVSGMGAIIMPFAAKSVAAEVSRDRIPLFYAAFLLCLTGLLGMAVTGDAFNVFVFLEISSLSSYTLIALGRDRRALTAAYQYLIMGTLGATFILIGIGFLYVMTGSLNMADLAVRLPEVQDTRTIRVAFGFLTLGICLKLALFPLHLWLPNAYAFAPSTVSAFLASTATKVAVYLLLRFFYTVFGGTFSFEVMQLDRVLLLLSLIAIFSMSLVAIFQENVKRMLAYSSVAQIGYMILGVSMTTSAGLTAGILHLFNHALMKGALFLALGAMVYRLGSAHLSGLGGVGRVMPWTTAAFVLGGLSLIGVPLTVGFVSKWQLVLAALELGWWPVVVLILVTSLMAVVYIGRVVEVAYFRPWPASRVRVEEAPLSLLIPTWVLLLVNVYLGVDSSFTTGAASLAAGTLMGGVQ